MSHRTALPDELQLGTVLPTRELVVTGRHDPAPIVELAADLDRCGVDSLWIGESVSARPRMDAYVLLGAVAAVTTTVTLGTAVVLPALRVPVAWAHQVATIDRLCGGRLVLGIGSGFPGEATESEFAALGVDHRGRVARTESALVVARSLWSGGAAVDDPTGRFDSIDVSVAPPPCRPSGPPTWLATATPAGIERCGRLHDGWLPYPPDPHDYRTGLEAVRAAAADAGRHPADVAAGLYVTVAIGVGDEPHRRLDDYCTAYYGLSSEYVGLVQGLVAGDPDEVADRISEYVHAGARHLVIRHASFDVGQVRDEAIALHAELRRRHGAVLGELTGSSQARPGSEELTRCHERALRVTARAPR